MCVSRGPSAISPTVFLIAVNVTKIIQTSLSRKTLFLAVVRIARVTIVRDRTEITHHSQRAFCVLSTILGKSFILSVVCCVAVFGTAQSVNDSVLVYR